MRCIFEYAFGFELNAPNVIPVCGAPAGFTLTGLVFELCALILVLVLLCVLGSCVLAGVVCAWAELEELGPPICSGA